MAVVTANKVDKQDLVQRIEQFFNEGLGARAGRVLKDSACMKLLLDKDAFTLEKKNGVVIVREGEPEDFDILIRSTKDFFDYFLNSPDHEELRRRLGEAHAFPTTRHHIFMETHMPRGEEAVKEFFWKGYSFWARRMYLTEG